jgi:hypothetical protein
MRRRTPAVAPPAKRARRQPVLLPTKPALLPPSWRPSRRRTPLPLAAPALRRALLQAPGTARAALMPLFRPVQLTVLTVRQSKHFSSAPGAQMEPPETLLCPIAPQQNACRAVLDMSGAFSTQHVATWCYRC